MDLKKAFESGNHQIIIKKLPHFVININIRSWLQNYRENRKQKCTVNGKTSCELCITCGVPQGSILGLLLFLFYINDIDKDLLHSMVQLYVDDMVLYVCHEQEEFVHLWLSGVLKSLSKWCCRNQLTININQTKVMLFGTKIMFKKEVRHDTRIEGAKLQYVNF